MGKETDEEINQMFTEMYRKAEADRQRLRNESIKMLKEQERLIKALENKPETEGFCKNNGFIYILKDNANIGHYKIGLSENPSKRINDLNGGSSTNSLELVKKMRGVSYNWIESGEYSIGVIAQEVEKILPEVVLTTEERKPGETTFREIKSVDSSRWV